MSRLKSLLAVVVVIVAAAFGLIELPDNAAQSTSTAFTNTAPQGSQTRDNQPSQPYTSDERIQQAFHHKESDLQVLLAGKVIKTLPDDNEGSRHQKFLFRLDSGQTLLVAHNIDLAPRINRLAEGDTVTVYGEYEWNERGGVIHWTHHDPRGNHEGGWIEHQGQRYE